MTCHPRSPGTRAPQLRAAWDTAWFAGPSLLLRSGSDPGSAWGPLPLFTWLFVSVPGAAEKPYMVEEAVSYNELDYISVSAAWVRSALLEGAGVGGLVLTSPATGVSGASWWGVFVRRSVHGERFGQ